MILSRICGNSLELATGYINIKNDKMKGLPVLIFVASFVYVLGAPNNEYNWQSIPQQLSDGFNNKRDELEKRYDDFRNTILLDRFREIYDSIINKFQEGTILRPLGRSIQDYKSDDSEESRSSDNENNGRLSSEEEYKKDQKEARRKYLQELIKNKSIEDSDSSETKETNESSGERRRNVDKDSKESSDEDSKSQDSDDSEYESSNSEEKKKNRSRNGPDLSVENPSTESDDNQDGSEEKSESDKSINRSSLSSEEAAEKHPDEDKGSSDHGITRLDKSNSFGSNDDLLDNQILDEEIESYYRNLYQSDIFNYENFASRRIVRDTVTNVLNARGIVFPESQSNQESARILPFVRPSSLIDLLEEIRRKIFGTSTTARPIPIPDVLPSGVAVDTSTPATIPNLPINVPNLPIPVDLPVKPVPIPVEFVRNIPNNLISGLLGNNEEPGVNNKK